MLLKILAGLIVVIAAVVTITWRIHTDVRIDRVFDAPVEKVWQTWTDPESIKKYWGPKGYSAPVIKSDFQVGGKFLYSMQAPGGEIIWNAGIYSVIEPQKLIEQHLSFSDADGNITPGSKVPVPGSWTDHVAVVVEFKEENGKTHLFITEEGIPMIMSILAKMGWEQQFDKFETLLK